MIILTEPPDPMTADRRCPALRVTTKVAALLGWSVYPVPLKAYGATSAATETYEQKLLSVPAPPQPSVTFWLGDRPTPPHYTAVYQAALQRNLQLVNSPEQHQRVSQGSGPDNSNGSDYAGSPISTATSLKNTFRVILYRGRVITYGYIGDPSDPQRYLSSPEEDQLFMAAFAVAEPLAVPFIAVDLEQSDSTTWNVIQTDDPQFCALISIPLIQFWCEIEKQILFSASLSPA